MTLSAGSRARTGQQPFRTTVPPGGTFRDHAQFAVGAHWAGILLVAGGGVTPCSVIPGAHDERQCRASGAVDVVRVTQQRDELV